MSTRPLDDLIAQKIAELPDRRLVDLRPIRCPRKVAKWEASIHRAYSYLTSRLRDPSLQPELDRRYEQTLAEGADFLKVRNTADFSRVPIVPYRYQEAVAIMQQAREIEQETYAARSKGKHGGAVGRMALQLLEWFCFTMWPRARFGMFPSVAHIADGARMSKASVHEALKTLQLWGFLTVKPRRKLIDTTFGVKVVQDTNAYVLNLAKGLGQLALAVIGRKSRPSESRKPLAKRTDIYTLKAKAPLEPETVTFFEEFAARHSTA
jgi:hypothetical protein